MTAIAVMGVALFVAAPGALASAPAVTKTAFSEVTPHSTLLEAEVTTGSKFTEYQLEYDTSAYGEGEGPHGSVALKGKLLAGETPAQLNANVEGLKAATIYHFRVVVKNNEGEVPSADRPFATYPVPITGLPDGRAYEQVSPPDKNGGDALGTVPFVKAAFGGGEATFASSSGIPGGVGAQELPLYLGSRGGGGWSSQGLLPEASLGQKAQVIGWTGDFSQFFQQATIFGSPTTRALFVRSGKAGGPSSTQQITPYLPGTSFAFAGANAGNSEDIFEANARLGTTPEGLEDHSNVYAWQGSAPPGQQLHLISVMNDEEPPPAGAFAGPYDWMHADTNKGGAAAGYYTQDTNAVGEDGSAFFTAAGSGQLYERLNPTRQQSPMSGGQCEDPETKACTLHLSASDKTNGSGVGGRDAAGEAPAAFQLAAADGKSAFFTSSEKLTNDANTGPEPEAAKIGRAKIGAGEAEEALPEFIARKAVGLAVSGEHLYWADPVDGEIGRAKLNGSGAATEVEPAFIVPGDTCFETHPETEPGTSNCALSTPRYVTVQGEFIYWTNTGSKGGDAQGQQLDVALKGAGTIGRAKIDPVSEEAKEVDPEFIVGASDPQGIAANAGHLYWANALGSICANGSCLPKLLAIARAGIGGDAIEEEFNSTKSEIAVGVTLDGTYLYWSENEPSHGGERFGWIYRMPLEGGEGQRLDFEDGTELGSITIAGPRIYWVDRKGGAIGRLALGEWGANEDEVCVSLVGCDTEFAQSLTGTLMGLAVEPGGERLYWSTNGETPPNPGNDLYRYEVEGGALADIALNSSDPEGIDVQGVLGASTDAKQVYFAANGVPDGGVANSPNANGEEAEAGDCAGRLGSANGECNLYLWEDDGSAKGAISFLARLDAGGPAVTSDAANWAGTPEGIPGGFERTAFASPDGQTLLFRSQRQLTAYENEGVAELYLRRQGKPLACVSCDPTLAPPGGPPSLGSVRPTALRAIVPASLASRNLTDEGRRAFFETTEALVANDDNGDGGCSNVGGGLQVFPSCEDVYEWEAVGTGSCEESSPSYSPQNGGCLYLISRGEGDYPSLIADASGGGEDVFFFSREGLVGQDKDELLDLYDARVEGGIAAQNPLPGPPPCESAEACHAGASLPREESPSSSTFVSPPNPKPRWPHAKKKHRRKQGHHHRKGKGRGAHRDHAGAGRRAGR